MKAILILTIIIFTHSIPREDCVSYGCVCVDANVRFIQAPPCPDEAANKCYANTTKCERQKKTGECGFTETKELTKCLEKRRCFITGCSSEVCAEEPTMTTCIFNPKFECYRGAECKVQGCGKCGWTMTSEIRKCLAEEQIPKKKSCVITGCNSDICAEHDTMTICEYNPKAICYNGAECKAQEGGNCGWTMTPDLNKCLGNS
jgi:hypothetical protein